LEVKILKKISRKNFIKFAFTSGLALSCGSFFSGCNEFSRNVENNLHELGEKFSGDLDLKFLRQIISKNPTSRTLMWQSDSKMFSPVVELKLDDEIKKISAEKNFFSDDGEEIFQYVATLENLLPEKIYNYRIVDGEHATDFFSLKTFEKNFKAIIFPDSQSADYNVWGGVAKIAFEKNPDANFFVNVGDIVDNGEDSSQWRAWFNQISEKMKILPFAPVMGNHETYNRDWKVREPVAYLNYFSVPDNNFEKFSRRFYSFDFGAAHFVILDSQWDELGREIIDVQKNWLREDISNTKKIWKIAFIHKDVLQYRINGRPERREGFSDVGEIFMPEFENLNFDAVFTAHLHTYRNRGRLKNFRADDTGPLYILTGLSGDVRYSNLWINHALDKIIAPQPEIDNYLTLEVDDKNLLVKSFLHDGTQFDETLLTKSF